MALSKTKKEQLNILNKEIKEENKKRTGLGQNQKFSKVSRKLNPKLPWLETEEQDREQKGRRAKKNMRRRKGREIAAKEDGPTA